jgi:hypothetical protein
VEVLYKVWKLPFHQTPQALSSVFQTTGCHAAQNGGGAGGAHMGTTASCGIGPPCPGGGRKSRPCGAEPGRGVAHCINQSCFGRGSLQLRV